MDYGTDYFYLFICYVVAVFFYCISSIAFGIVVVCDGWHEFTKS